MNKGLPPLNAMSLRNIPTVPMLIAIPYWEGDHQMARKMTELIADLQPHHIGHVCHILLVCRQDYFIDKDMAINLSKKFNVHTHIGTSPLRGWPSGPNGMFGTTMIHISNAMTQFQSVFWMEPDCVPMCTNWFADLINIWIHKHPLAKIVGCRHDCNGDGTGDHITGCAIYDSNIARILPQITTCDNVAWDYYCRRLIVQIGQHTNYIANRYKATNAEQTILNDKAVLIHGFKDDSLLKLVRDHKVNKLLAA